MSVPYEVVIPTTGRDSLGVLLESLSACGEPRPERVLVVDDRRDARLPLELPHTALSERTKVVRGPARGPAAARNAGWRAGSAPWVVFIDDDVVLPADWGRRLQRDLLLNFGAAGVQGRLEVPLPAGRRPTDWERNVAGLAGARWATADMAYRRDHLEAVGGFDERFPRAYREDADLALRVMARGGRLVVGQRRAIHPVRPAGRLVSLRLQAGNADDALMLILHGRGWRERADAPRGRRPLHFVTVACALACAGALALRRRNAAALAGAAWAGFTGELAARRILPGPRDRDEVTAMVATSVLMPFLATWHYLKGLTAAGRVLRGERT